ncbi:MAG: SPFH domain-containing protein [Bacteroidetes bacterium]|nr:SPFH domain-containing protein [Bacteroidota bacterium]
MGLFSSKGEGGLMDVIRCDEQEYLIWKWRPSGGVNSTKKENSIRWGSSLRVKDGEVAAFIYKQKDGTIQDFIEGPYDQTIKTANFPILTSLIGLFWDGKSPFQAEIYFINLAGNIQIKFGIPYFDVFDPRFLDFGVPTAARGSITFNITDFKSFIKLHRMINFEIEAFKNQIKDAVVKYVKGTITNIPSDNGMPVLQLERKLLEINDMIQPRIKEALENSFGVNLKRFDLSVIDFDKESDGYKELRKITAEQQAKTVEAQTNVGIKNLEDTQEINAKNMDETLRVQREEMQRKQKLQTETQHLDALKVNVQGDVLKAAAENLGKMGNMDLGGGSGGGLNPAGMMTGMMLGGAMGNQMAGMMGNINNPQNQQTPPPLPSINYFIVINGQQNGPYNMQQMLELVQSQQLKKETLVWKQGMQNWLEAGQVQELNGVFSTIPPPIPPPIPPQLP